MDSELGTRTPDGKTSGTPLTFFFGSSFGMAATMGNKAAMSTDAVETYPEVIARLEDIYKNKIRPVEELYLFNEFNSHPLEDADFEAAPMVVRTIHIHTHIGTSTQT